MNLLKLANGVSSLVVGAEGNVSEKTYNGFIIKASGSDMRALTIDDIVACNKLGQQIDCSNKQPSIETGFHAWLLEQPSINFIAHTHPTNTLKILCSDFVNEFARVRLFPDQVVYNGSRSCVVQYAMPGIELLEQIKVSVTRFITEENYFPKIILLKNHGIICAASSYKQCIIASEICEKAAEIFIGSKLLGKINGLNEYDIQTIKNDQKEIYRQSIIN
jgi:ribulose-5-phosphate 4-epimerase/fuculose-1-phosphate aldolase